MIEDKVFVFGCNSDGQLGLARSDDILLSPSVVIPLHFEASSVTRIGFKVFISVFIDFMISYSSLCWKT